jgi:hypothetical protein
LEKGISIAIDSLNYRRVVSFTCFTFFIVLPLVGSRLVEMVKRRMNEGRVWVCEAARKTWLEATKGIAMKLELKYLEKWQ